MGYLIGYFGFPFIIGFLIVHFGIAKRYEKKHDKKYSVGKKVLYTVLIGLALVLVMFMGQ